MTVRLPLLVVTLGFTAAILPMRSVAQINGRTPQAIPKPTFVPEKKAQPKKTEPLAYWARLAMPAETDNGGWAIAPEGDLELLTFVAKNTDLAIPVEWHTADVENLEEMCRYPILFATNDYAPNLSERARSNIREYLLRGGFLFADDCDGPRDHDQFYRRMQLVLPEILPEAQRVELNASHPLFNLRFRVPRLPLVHGYWHPLSAWIYRGRIVAVLTSTDLHCGWCGHTGSESDARPLAFQLGTNIVVYAVTQSAIGVAREAKK